jgi:hypothetical protein
VNGENAVKKTVLPAEAIPIKGEETLALAGRVEKGDRTALPALREVLKDPAAVDALGGDLAGRIQQKLIAKFTTGKKVPNPLLRESLTRKLELLRDELAGPNPNPLERLLVERVVTCWLHLHFFEMFHASQDTMSPVQMTCWGRILDCAQKRYLAAIRMLATVRRLSRPLPALPAALEARLTNGAAAPGTNGTARKAHR